MPLSQETFRARLDTLHAEMTSQCARVQAFIECAVDAVFSADASYAARCVRTDDEIDRVDVAIEKAAVALLSEVASTAITIPETDLRLILTIVKVNNEAERMADLAATIAAEAPAFAALKSTPPETFRVVANSVIGIVDSARRRFESTDARTARVVLNSEDAVERFRKQLLRDTEERSPRGALTVDEGVALLTIAAELARIADHATNIAEQVIYAASGAIVRHGAHGWVETRPE